MIRTTFLLLAGVGGLLHLHGAAQAQEAAMKWVDFDGPEVPRNRAGDTYPSQYQGEGGRAIVSLDPKGRRVRPQRAV